MNLNFWLNLTFDLKQKVWTWITSWFFDLKWAMVMCGGKMIKKMGSLSKYFLASLLPSLHISRQMRPQTVFNIFFENVKINPMISFPLLLLWSSPAAPLVSQFVCCISKVWLYDWVLGLKARHKLKVLGLEVRKSGSD